jgi:DUF1680 family protein
MYFLCGAADVTARGDRTYVPAMDKLWQDMVERKMYITGGVGAKHEGEAFGNAYELPNDTAVRRDLCRHRQRAVERAAESADGRREIRRRRRAGDVQRHPERRVARGRSVLLREPAGKRRKHHRVPWFDCACCPAERAAVLRVAAGADLCDDEQRHLHQQLQRPAMRRFPSPAGR